jgi:hypothetical protein
MAASQHAPKVTSFYAADYRRKKHFLVFQVWFPVFAIIQ